VLVFSALILFALAGFFALTIDIGRLSDAKEQKIQGAEESALAALHKYLSYDVDPLVCVPGAANYHECRHTEKFTWAKEIAAVTGSWNYQTFVNQEHMWSAADFGGGDPRGAIVSGRWWDRFPDACLLGGGPACPCADPLPCFQPCPDGAPGCDKLPSPATAPDNGYASAMRVSFFTPLSNRLKFIFGDVLGIPDARIGYSAGAGSTPSVATILPKFTVLLIDLGRNMVADSHLPWEKNPTHSAASSHAYTANFQEFAYLSDAACPMDITTANVAEISPDPDNLSAMVANLEYNKAWNGTGFPKGSYECVTNPYNADPYIVQTVDDVASFVASPLRDSLSAINAYLREFADVATGTDIICPVFYDHQIRPNASFGITADCFDKSGANFQRLLKMTNVAAAVWNDATDTCPDGTTGCYSGKYVQLYPRQGAFSDLPRAIDTGLNRILVNGSFMNGDNAMASFTNGLTNCAPSGGNVICRQYLRVANGDAANAAAQDIYYGIHKASLDEFINNRVAYSLQTRAIRFHSFIVGASVLPHTPTVRTNGSWQCKSEIETRSRRFMSALRFPPIADDANPAIPSDPLRVGYDNVAQFHYHAQGMGIPPAPAGANVTGFVQAKLDASRQISGGPPAAFYYYPTANIYFYNAAAITQGIWAPLRPLCPPLPYTAAITGMDNICAMSPMPPATVPVGFQTELFSARYAPASAPNKIRLQALINRGIVDQFGRLLCNPMAASAILPGENAISQTARFHANDLLTTRPITLVRVP